ncbi:unknown [Firmicutes bacterium CAG:240]|nr:unknown [Firmicutes bacterium CAG:240]
MASVGEGICLIADGALHNFTDMAVYLVPDRKIAHLGLIDAVQCLCNAVDGVGIGLCSNLPLLPLELHKLILTLNVLAHEVKVHGNTSLVFDELPALLDILLDKLVCEGIVKYHGHLQSKQRLVVEPVLKNSSTDGAVAGLVAGYHERTVVRNIVKDVEAGLSLAHRAGVAGQADGLNCVDVVVDGVRVNVAGYEVRDHFQSNCLKLVAPAVEHTAPYGFLHCHGVIPCIVLLSAVESGIGIEHCHELIDGRVDHCAIMPCGAAQSLAAHAFHAAVKPVQNGQIGLAYPTVAPYALCKVDKAAVLHYVHYHVDVVVQPNIIEVVEGVLYAAPLSMLVNTGLREVIFTEAATAFFCGMGLAIPKIL